MKENIKYFETLNDTNGYIINDIPFTSYIKENGLVIFNNAPNKMLINLNGYVIIHKIVNVIFETLNDADGYIIETIPFSCYIKENYLFLECNQDDCKIVVENGIAVIKERGDIIRYTATSKVIPYRPSSLPTIISNDFDPNTGKGVIKFETDVKNIGNLAFMYCRSLTSIVIPNSVTSIGESAFIYCSSLHSVTIPNSIDSIGHGAFAECSGLTSIEIPNSVTSIGGYAFSGCTGLTSITIPNSVTSIGDGAFSSCSSLTSVTIPNSVTHIGVSAFGYCSSLTKVNITDIAAWCNITFTLYTGNPLYYAKHLYVNDVEVTNLVIPEGVTSIRGSAFYNCTGLTSVTIPNSVTSIGYKTFYECTGLTSISYAGTISQYNSITKGNQWHNNVPATQVYCLGENPPAYTPI